MLLNLTAMIDKRNQSVLTRKESAIEFMWSKNFKYQYHKYRMNYDQVSQPTSYMFHSMIYNNYCYNIIQFLSLLLFSIE